MRNLIKATTPGDGGPGGDGPNKREGEIYFTTSLLALGYKIFPCGPDKKPLTRHGHKDASSGPDQVKAWWDKNPAALVGIPCKDNGFFAVDVDDLDAWEQYKRGRELPPGPVQSTPRGGLHFLFKYPLDVDIPNTASKLAAKIDLRSNGYICTGQGYSWLTGMGIDEKSLPDAPAWLLDDIRKMAEKPEYKTRPAGNDGGDPGQYRLDRYLAKATPGNRNDLGFSLACQLRDSGLSIHEAESILREYAQRVPGPDYSESEATASLREAFKTHPREPAKLKSRRPRNPSPAELQEEPPANYDDEPQAQAPLILLTELGNSRRFSERFKKKLLHDSTRGWLMWTGKKWDIDETGQVVTLAKKVIDDIFDEAKETEGQAKMVISAAQKLPDDASAADREALKDRLDKLQARAKLLLSWAMKSQTEHQATAMISLAQSDLPARPSDFDSDPWSLNCDNGVLDLRTGKLLPHNPNQRITKIAGAAYDPGAKCPLWLRFLDRVFDHDQVMMDYIQRVVGYSLTGLTIEQCLFFLYGAGSNGKTVFCETLAAMLGDYARKTPTDTLMAKYFDNHIPNDLARLPGARVVLAAELVEGKRLNESLVKDLTGGDRITARFLHREFFEFIPTFKILMYGNHKPAIRGTDEGIWRRVRLIPFTVTIPEGERDLSLTQKLRAELPGILAWAVSGCIAWQQAGLKTPAPVTLATSEYRAEQDLLAAFLEACCVIGPEYKVTAGELYTAFKAWAIENGEPERSQTRFGGALSERGISTKERQSGTGRWFYKGIGLLDKEESQRGFL